VNPFSLLIKPAGADCNLRCRYCFYLDRCELYPETPRHRMDDVVLERVVRSYLATAQPVYTFGWQGGEPTLMGEGFFRRATELQQSCGRPGAQVANGLQTNGTLITDGLAAHLAARHFLVGVSVDGPAAIHDLGRPTLGGQGSHALALDGIERLRRHGVDFNVLTLVSRSNVDRPVETYEYLLDLGVLFHQYIECVEFDASGGLLPFAITADEWGRFLCGVFDRWSRGDMRRVSVRLFDTIVMQLVDGVSNTCASGRDCRQYYVVEYNGDVYPCDFYVRADLRLGNVLTDSWEAMQASEAYAAFGSRKRAWHAACDACPYLRFCNGDCPKNRVGHGQGDTRTLSHLCQGWRTFYRHALPTLTELAQDVKRERTRAAAAAARCGPVVAAGSVPGRNGSCPCGSGRKFKKCCGVAAGAGRL
jgi:uncharacterized protein